MICTNLTPKIHYFLPNNDLSYQVQRSNDTTFDVSRKSIFIIFFFCFVFLIFIILKILCHFYIQKEYFEKMKWGNLVVSPEIKWAFTYFLVTFTNRLTRFIVYWSAFWNLAISFVNKLELRVSACGTTNSQFTTNCEWKCVVFCTILTFRLKSCSIISLNQSTSNYVKLT